ncbi:MAG TPA: hypothetical protein VFO79_00085 [Xanthomonadales bacterium]|nr:hypothetical protein [Xanthomonadales bacterium]
MTRLRLLLAASLILSPLVAAAQPVTTALRELYRLDVQAASATRIGAFGFVGGQQVADIEGLAYAPNGTLYGVSDASRMVYRLNPATGAATPVAPLEIADTGAFDYGLAFTCDGRAWLSSDSTRAIYELDIVSGRTLIVGTTPVAISGLAGRNDTLYGIGVGADEGIYRIDPLTGATTLLTRFDLSNEVVDAGLDFDAAGRLWATLDFNPPTNGVQVDHSDVAEFDRTTGALISARRIAGIPQFTDLEGLALAPPSCDGGGGGVQATAGVPVDAPPALAVLIALCGLIGLAAVQRRAA